MNHKESETRVRNIKTGIDTMNNNLNDKPYIPTAYDHYILKTLPYVQEFYQQTISMIRQYGRETGKLLDLGCGTGMLEKLLREAFPELAIVAVDPSEDMLKEAEEKQVPEVEYRLGTSQELSDIEEYDVITAIMSHHLMQPEERKDVISKIYRALKKEGVFISFENVLPEEDDYLKENELSRWQQFQIEAGKPEEDAESHRARCGVFYFPITVKEHIRLLKEAGFQHVYVFWKTYMQMGIMGIKGNR